jgi:hypothetical protein
LEARKEKGSLVAGMAVAVKALGVGWFCWEVDGCGASPKSAKRSADMMSTFMNPSARVSDERVGKRT